MGLQNVTQPAVKASFPASRRPPILPSPSGRGTHLTYTLIHPVGVLLWVGPTMLTWSSLMGYLFAGACTREAATRRCHPPRTCGERVTARSARRMKGHAPSASASSMVSSPLVHLSRRWSPVLGRPATLGPGSVEGIEDRRLTGKPLPGKPVRLITVEASVELEDAGSLALQVADLAEGRRVVCDRPPSLACA